MQFCNFCAKNSEHVKQIDENTVIINNKAFKIRNLLHIYLTDIVQFLYNKDTLICHNCLKQLRESYEFVQQIKESEIKLIQGKEIKTEHDYFDTTTGNLKNETVIENVTVNEVELNYDVKKFKKILPKPVDDKNATRKCLRYVDSRTRFYKCLHCTEAFKSFKHLKEHEHEFCQYILIKDYQICRYCNKFFGNETSLSSHVSVKHAHKEFRCCLCQDKSFAGKGYLSRHIKKVHCYESLTYFCGECDELEVIISQQELREHFLTKHVSEASRLSKEIQTEEPLNNEDMDLEMHEEFLDEFLLAHNNENSFQFSECWEALDLHLPDMLQASAASVTEPFSCPKCFTQFKNPQPLLKHLAELHNLPVLICRVCTKCFASFKDFKFHKLQKCFKSSSINLQLLECPYCSKTFKNSLNLKQHLRTVHSQLKRHICQLCDKQFSTLDHLKKHVLSQHQNERKHICMVCDKKFTQLGHLKQHLAIHTTGKTIQCLECSLKFWRKIDLERHRANNHVLNECADQ